MKYNLKNPLDAAQAKARFDFLVEKGARIDLTEKRGKWSIGQRGYIHLIMKAWAYHLGSTPDQVKQDVKMYLMASMFEYYFDNKKYYRSMADLSTVEANQVIDVIRTTANDSTGFYIPAPNETEMLRHLENECERYG